MFPSNALILVRTLFAVYCAWNVLTPFSPAISSVPCSPSGNAAAMMPAELST